MNPHEITNYVGDILVMVPNSCAVFDPSVAMAVLVGAFQGARVKILTQAVRPPVPTLLWRFW